VWARGGYAKKIIEAVKRGKPCDLIDDLAICVQLGWTYTELQSQPARFVERLMVYLGAVADIQTREHRRLEEELNRLKRGLR